MVLLKNSTSYLSNRICLVANKLRLGCINKTLLSNKMVLIDNSTPHLSNRISLISNRMTLVSNKLTLVSNKLTLLVTHHSSKSLFDSLFYKEVSIKKLQ
jgi:hypothetical protein